MCSVVNQEDRILFQYRMVSSKAMGGEKTDRREQGGEEEEKKRGEGRVKRDGKKRTDTLSEALSLWAKH